VFHSIFWMGHRYLRPISCYY